MDSQRPDLSLGSGATPAGGPSPAGLTFGPRWARESGGFSPGRPVGGQTGTSAGSAPAASSSLDFGSTTDQLFNANRSSRTASLATGFGSASASTSRGPGGSSAASSGVSALGGPIGGDDNRGGRGREWGGWSERPAGSGARDREDRGGWARNKREGHDRSRETRDRERPPRRGDRTERDGRGGRGWSSNEGESRDRWNSGGSDPPAQAAPSTAAGRVPVQKDVVPDSVKYTLDAILKLHRPTTVPDGMKIVEHVTTRDSLSPAMSAPLDADEIVRLWNAARRGRQNKHDNRGRGRWDEGESSGRSHPKDTGSKDWETFGGDVPAAGEDSWDAFAQQASQFEEMKMAAKGGRRAPADDAPPADAGGSFFGTALNDSSLDMPLEPEPTSLSGTGTGIASSSAFPSSSGPTGVAPAALAPAAGAVAASAPAATASLESTPWFYLDPQKRVQGPFTTAEMREWFEAGYFKPELPIRQGTSGSFVPLAKAFASAAAAFRTAMLPEQAAPAPAPETAAPTMPTATAQVAPAGDRLAQIQADLVRLRQLQAQLEEMLYREAQTNQMAQAAGQLTAARVQRFRELQEYHARVVQSAQAHAQALQAGAPAAAGVAPAPQAASPGTMARRAESERAGSEIKALIGVGGQLGVDGGEPAEDEQTAAARDAEIRAAQAAAAREAEARAKQAERQAAERAAEERAKQAEREIAEREAARAEARQREAERMEAKKAEMERLEAAKRQAEAEMREAAQRKAEELARAEREAAERASQKAAEDAKRKAQAASNAAWSKSAKGNRGLSLIEIQREEEKQRKARAAAEAANPPPPKSAGAWAQTRKAPVAKKVMSLREIQEAELKAANEAASRAHASERAATVTAASIVRGGTGTGTWGAGAAPAAVAAPPPAAAAPAAATAGGDDMFWDFKGDEARRAVTARPAPSAAPTPAQSVAAAPRRKARAAPAKPATAAAVVAPTSSKGDSNAFGGSGMSADMMRWCRGELRKLTGSEDITLMQFCMTLESAADVREYIREYMGSTPQVSAFASEFIKRRKGHGGDTGGKAAASTRRKKGGGRRR